MRPAPAALFLPAALLLLAACSRPPDVLVVTFDTTRADAVGFSGGDRRVTPVLDSLAARGTWFSTAMTAQPLTMPAHSTIFTGLYPFHHGVRNNGTHVLAPSQTTLAERLRARGWATHAIVSSFVLDSRFGLAQGFEGYDDDLSSGRRNVSFGMREGLASRVADRAVAWLRGREKKDAPFFLWLHFYDPHSDYRPPADVAAKFPGKPYEAEIHYADRELGRVVRELERQGRLENTLVVFTADHGEGFGEHGENEHGMFVYDSTMRVPMFLAGPGVPRGTRIGGVVRTADLVPTLLDLLGLPAEKLDGASIRPLLDGRAEAPRAAYLESLYGRMNFGWSELRALRTAELKVIAAPEREVYAIGSDPKETRNVAASDPQGARPLIAELGRIAGGDAAGDARHEVDGETRRQLAALGYLTGSGGENRRGPRPDPKAMREVFRRFQDAHTLSARKQFAQAAAMFEQVVARDPENTAALVALATAQHRARQYEPALTTWKRIVAADPSNRDALSGAVQSLMAMRRFGESEELARAVIRLAPAEGRVLLGEQFLVQERFAEAEAAFRAALAAAPGTTLAISGLGNALNRAGRLEEAKKVLRDGFAKHPESAAIAYNLAVVSERSGDVRAASLLYQLAMRHEPEHSMAWNNLGSLFARAGRRDDALRCVGRAVAADPANVEAVYNLGALLLAAGRPLDALPWLENALRLSPGFPPALVQRAFALGAAGRSEEAAAAWVGLVRAELERGNEDGAREQLRRARAALGDRLVAAAEKDARVRRLL